MTTGERRCSTPGDGHPSLPSQSQPVETAIQPITSANVPSNAHGSYCNAITGVAQLDGDSHLDSLPSSKPAAPVKDGPPSPPSSPRASVSQLVNKELITPEWLKFRLSSGFFAYFLCGWGDSVTGTVLPYFTASYHLNPMTSSLLFAGSTCGFFVGTFIVERIVNFFGQCSAEHSTNSLVPYIPFFRFKTQKDGASSIRHSASQARHLTLIFSSVLHAMFFIMVGRKGGFAITFMAYVVAALARSFITGDMIFVGVGGVVSPIVCQAIIAKGVPWPNFYFGSLVLPTIKENEREWAEYLAERSTRSSSPACLGEENQKEKEVVLPSPRSYRSHKKTAEVATGSMQILKRLVLALSMHVLIWKINSFIENAVSAACIGLLYGSIFPAILRLTNDILPADVQMISMGVISAFASVGSGVISRSKGIHTMPYITVPLSIVLIGLWSLFPTRLPSQRSTVV
ncbi:hypothetical protein H0H92_002419 [Tricholoma furcatifolium]|nr:hypothetical protein H0H92_002419 [Tricholoma furcatifolium]